MSVLQEYLEHVNTSAERQWDCRAIYHIRWSSDWRHGGRIADKKVVPDDLSSTVRGGALGSLNTHARSHGALEWGVVCACHTEVSDITKSEHIRGGRSSDWRATYILLPAIFELKKTSLVGKTGAATRQRTTMWC